MTWFRKKEENHHAEDGAETGQKMPRPTGLGPTKMAGLTLSEAQRRPPFMYAMSSTTLAGALLSLSP